MPYSTFSDAQIESLIKAIDSDGYAVLPDWASAAQLKDLQDLVTETVAAAGNTSAAGSRKAPRANAQATQTSPRPFVA